MARGSHHFDILDKDLGRVSNAEHAAAQAHRPLARIGGAGVPLALALLALLAGGSGAATVGLAIAAGLALALGGRGAGLSLAPAVGAGAIGMAAGLALLASAQISGALLASGEVTARLSDGIVAHPSARMMVAALGAAAMWACIATWARAPVSITQALVGAIAGAGIASQGWAALNWPALALIAGGWICTPLIAGALTAALMALYQRAILDQPDRLAAARDVLAVLAGVIALIVGLDLIHGLTRVPPWPGLGFALALAIAAGGFARARISGQIARAHDLKRGLRALLTVPLVVAMLALGFAHGANDAAKIIAPLAVVLEGAPVLAAPVLAALTIAAGSVLFGRRLVYMIGSDKTRLNTTRALCVTLATAATVIAASYAGLPVSVTHVALGGVFGAGAYRARLDRRRAKLRRPLPVEERLRRRLVRRSFLRTTLGGWAITAPACAALAAGCAVLIG